MYNWISTRKARLTKDELQDIRNYIGLFLGRSDDATITPSDDQRIYAFVKRTDNLTLIPPSLAAFLVKDCEEYAQEMWFMLPSSLGPSFQQTLPLLIDHYGNAKLCRLAGISRRTYYKLFDPAHVPSKDVIIRLAMANALSLGETHVLLNRAGHELNKFCERDLILDYCFQESICDIDIVNDTLRRLGHPTLKRK